METRLLAVALSDSEWRERAARMARKRSELDRVTEEKKARMAGYKSRLDDIQAEISKLARAVETHAEDRDVPIEKQVDAATRMLRIVRLDNGELVEERALTLEEMGESAEQRQGRLPLGGDDLPGEERAAAAAGPVATLLVLAEHWERVPPDARRRVGDVLQSFDVSGGALDGVFRTTPLAVGGPALAALEALCRELGIPFERGDVADAPPDGAPDGEPGQATYLELAKRVEAATDEEGLADVWVDCQAAKDDHAITDEQYHALDAAWNERSDAVKRGEVKPPPIKPRARRAKKGAGAADA